MDSLQAFICAIQLDRAHYSAWLNLAILYEQDNQLEEALKCYKTAVKCWRSERSRIDKKKKKIEKNIVVSDKSDKISGKLVANTEEKRDR